MNTDRILATILRKLPDHELVSIAQRSDYFEETAETLRVGASSSASASAGNGNGNGSGSVSESLADTAKVTITPLAPKKRGRKPKVSSGDDTGSDSNGRKRMAKEDREALLDKIEEFVNNSDGVSASDITKGTGIEGSQLITAVRKLKEDQRIYQGGQLRFARYAGTAEQAERASLAARGK